MSPSASQETSGSSEVALVPPALGHLLSLLGAIPKGAGDAGDTSPQIPASVPSQQPEGGLTLLSIPSRAAKALPAAVPQISLSWVRKGEQVTCGPQGQSEITQMS